MILRFDGFEVDEERFELRRDGVIEALQPRAFDLLCALVRRPNVILGRAELRESVWSGVSVTNDALAQAVMTLRKVLGDSGDTPRYIETVRGRGFRFLGAVTSGPAHAPPASIPPPSSFVGHGEKLARVAERLGGEGGVVLVTSERGGGKTRFLDELAAEQPGLVRARSAPAGAPDLWLFTQLLRELQKRGTALDGPLRAIAESTFAAEALDDAAARFAIGGELVSLLSRASSASPLLLAADDLDAESARTLGVLELVVARLRETHAVLCATVTPSASTPPALTSLLGVLSRDPGVLMLRLAPLSSAEVAAFLEVESGAAPPASLVARIHHKTGGNPRLLVQLARRPKADWLRDANVRTGSLADGAALREAVAYQLSALPDEVRVVVTMAAVFGSSFIVAPLAAALGLENAATLSALDAASAVHVVARTGVGKYRFAHPLVRDVLHERLSAVERARLHGDAARALEAHLGDAVDHVRVAELAGHFVEAAATGDVDAAVDWCLRAAELADAAGDDVTAHAVAVRGLAVMDLGPRPDLARRARLRAWTE